MGPDVLLHLMAFLLNRKEGENYVTLRQYSISPERKMTDIVA